jgi:DNA transposition AAA+ family ATPase
MKRGFVLTENYKQLQTAQKLVSRRGAQEAGLVIIQGPYGVGKSELTARWAVDHGAVFVRCKETWTKRGLIDELADALGVDKRGRNQEVQARIIGKLAVSQIPLMFDEADHLIRSTASMLEVVRDITDTTGVVCYLVGMEQFAHKLARYGHIASRVARVVELNPLTIGDVRAACQQLSDVELTPSVVEQIHVQARGRMRLVLNAIATIEQWAEQSSLKSVSLEHIAGRTLVTEFTGKSMGRRATSAAELT